LRNRPRLLRKDRHGPWKLIAWAMPLDGASV